MAITFHPVGLFAPCLMRCNAHDVGKTPAKFQMVRVMCRRCSGCTTQILPTASDPVLARARGERSVGARRAGRAQDTWFKARSSPSTANQVLMASADEHRKPLKLYCLPGCSAAPKRAGYNQPFFFAGAYAPCLLSASNELCSAFPTK